MMKIKLLFCISLSIFIGNLSGVVLASGAIFGDQKKLSNTEQVIVKQIDSQQSQMLSLLKQVVEINSGTMNFSGVKQVGGIFSKELSELGFKTQWLDGKAFNRAGHLYASHIGSNTNAQTPKLLLIGHLDTVFAIDSPFQSFRITESGGVAGPGITDMKGGNVIMLSALKALHHAGILSQLKIKILLMGDEEKRGSPYALATKELVSAGEWADVALGFEDGDGDPKTAVISRRGATSWLLKVKGRPAHSSQIFREGYGYGAIFETARILNSFRERLSSVANLTFNPGAIVGGTTASFDQASANGTAFGKNNVIAEQAVVYGDIRALSPKQLAEAKLVMSEIVQNNLGETSAEISFSSGYPPMSPSAGNRKLLDIYNQASEDLGFGKVIAVNPRKAGAADISFVANEVEMALDGLGLMGSGGHTVKEVADIATLTSQAKRAALLMLRINSD
jgi:glutamate carboxypeptidase